MMDPLNAKTLNLAYACSWWRPSEPTWSYTPVGLRTGLRDIGVCLHDIEAQPPLWQQAPLAAWLSVSNKRPWKYTRTYRALEARRITRAVKLRRPDAVLEIADLTVPTIVPTYGYQDASLAAALQYYDLFGRDQITTIPTDSAILQQVASEQIAALQQLSGMFVMGRWFRDYLVDSGTLPEHRVHWVGGGIDDSYQTIPHRSLREARQRRRVLFIGSELRRKGGEAVVAAMEKLNRHGTRPLRLTVAGPVRWPLATAPSDWLDFRGALPRDEIQKLFQSHDLLVMPSRYEAYGKVFLEARACGIPCIGRDAFAMPELIEPPAGGALWKTDDISDLADLILSVLDNDRLNEYCSNSAAQFAKDHSWSRVAEKICRVITDNTK